VHLGALGELRARQPLYLREAVDRGDLYGSVSMRIGHANLLWLVDGDADGARRDVNDAIAEWSKQGFHIEHYYEMVALTQADLYSGEGARAHERILARWRAFRGSLLHTVQMLGTMALQLRARSAIAAAGAAKDDRKGTLLASAERDARAIERRDVAWATPMSKLLLAGAAWRRTDATRAAALLREALQGFEAADMALYAAAANRCLGTVIGGEAGKARVREAEEWMAAGMVKDSARLTAMLAPGFE
jgi:hypothetical protein